MRSFIQVSCIAAGLLLVAGCAHSESNHPRIYRGGAYYGDALHAQDLKDR